ncbi:LytR/AlgR family response regulator transcription factor [Leeuwenhoekiella parthenopeia]|uniref:LytTR family DNA-binding domain-containing protein n=1 Tax=Leeuwenhoekiella parthenopeia TaxID=2890320 RepID=A0ABS8GTZ6_9FLAO|nr:LytTR family DNA-binding domain-containing protein [Leeuwenhoekiella parthenopeia]MCC4213145.1 LytTR family DNA-binding domain-containing protein [Leeuwenhoekiella parthenopeia]
MNVLVIEDEKPAARRLTRMLEVMELTVVAQLHSVEEAVAWFETEEHPDLIFLDIQLSDGLSFEIFDAVTVKSAIIFTTAYDEYALQAFKLNSIDYLLKPIDEEELEAAVVKFKKQRPGLKNTTFNFEDIRKLLGVNPVDREYKKRFTVKIGQHLKMITIDEVMCVYSENKGTYVRTRDKRDYLLETTLENLEEELAPDRFFRVSRKYYVNIEAIQDIISYTNSRLQLKLKACEDHEIIVSRERVKDFKLWLS